MSLLFARNTLYSAMHYPARMASHVSSPARLSRRLLVSLQVFMLGFSVLEGLPCLHITHFGYETGLNDLLASGAPCPLAGLYAGASCAVRPRLRVARQLWYTAVL
jgi:hypothetical protein